MNYSYILDPELIELDKGEIVRSCLIKLFEETLIKDEENKVHEEYSNVCKKFPIIKTKVEEYLFKLEFSRRFLKKKIKAKCKYGKNFLSFVDNLLSNEIIPDFIITTKNNYMNIIGRYGIFSEHWKKTIFVHEDNFRDESIFNKIEEAKSKNISLPEDREDFINLMKFSSEIETYLFQAGKQLIAHDPSERTAYKHGWKPYQYITILEKKYKDQLHGCKSKEEVLDKYLKKQSCFWHIKDDHEVISNQVNKGGDQVIKTLMTLEYFISCFAESQKNSKFVFEKNRLFKIFVINNCYKTNNYLEEIVKNYFNKLNEYKNLIDIKFVFLRKLDDNKLKSRQSHLRHIVTGQKILNINDISIFSIIKESKKNRYSSSEEELNEMKYELNDCDFSLVQDHAKKEFDSSSKLAEFIKLRSEVLNQTV